MRPSSRADLARGPRSTPTRRFKYSNHGFGLVGLAIEAMTGERYAEWIAREIVAARGLAETLADVPLDARAAVRARPQRQAAARPPRRHPGREPDPRAGGGDRLRQHRGRPGALLRAAWRRSAKSERPVGGEPARDDAPPVARRADQRSSAGTASARSPAASATGTGSAIPAASRATSPAPPRACAGARDLRPDQRDRWPVARLARRRRAHPARLRAARRADAAPAGWSGRWWTLWGATDLVPAGERVFVVNPGQPNPFLDASVLEVGRCRAGPGGSASRPVSRGTARPCGAARCARRDKALWLAGSSCCPKAGSRARSKAAIRSGRGPRSAASAPDAAATRRAFPSGPPSRAAW